MSLFSFPTVQSLNTLQVNHWYYWPLYYACMRAQPRLTLCDPMDCSSRGGPLSLWETERDEKEGCILVFLGVRVLLEWRLLRNIPLGCSHMSTGSPGAPSGIGLFSIELGRGVGEGTVRVQASGVCGWRGSCERRGTEKRAECFPISLHYCF